MRIIELFHKDNQTGNKSLFTDAGDNSYKKEKDFFKKYFSRPFLTNGPKGQQIKKTKK